MAQPQRRIQPQARNEQRQEHQAHPSFTVIVLERAVARVLGIVALGVRRAMVAHALRAPDARYRVYGRADAVRRVLARAARVVGLDVQLVAVAAAHLGAVALGEHAFEGQRRLLHLDQLQGRLPGAGRVAPA